MGFKFSDPSTPFWGPFHPGTPFGLSIYQYPLIINRIWLFINGIRGFRWCWIHWWYFKRVLLTSGYRQGLWDLLSSRQTAMNSWSVHVWQIYQLTYALISKTWYCRPKYLKQLVHVFSHRHKTFHVCTNPWYCLWWYPQISWPSQH